MAESMDSELRNLTPVKLGSVPSVSNSSQSINQSNQHEEEEVKMERHDRNEPPDRIIRRIFNASQGESGVPKREQKPKPLTFTSNGPRREVPRPIPIFI